MDDFLNFEKLLNSFPALYRSEHLEALSIFHLFIHPMPTVDYYRFYERISKQQVFLSVSKLSDLINYYNFALNTIDLDLAIDYLCTQDKEIDWQTQGL